MKKAYRIVSMLLLVLFVFSASAYASPANVTLRMCWWGNDTRHQAHLDAIALYESLNPHVKIEAEYGGMEGYRQKLTTQLAGGQEPDLIWVDPPWLHDFATQGDFFVDLYTQDIMDYSTLDQEILKGYIEFDGKLIGIPTGYNAHIFIVDDRIAELGIDLDKDWTWDDLMEAGKKVHEANPNEYLLNSETKFINAIFFRNYMVQLIDDTLIGNDYTMNFTEEQLAQGLTMVQDLYLNNVVEPAQDADVYLQQSTTNPKWMSGELRGALCWSSTATSTQGFPDNIKAMRYPRIEGSTQSGATVRPMPPVCISKNSASVEESLKFLDFYINDPRAIEIMAPTRPFAPTAAGQEEALKQQTVRQSYVDAFNLAAADPGIPDNPPSTNSEVENAFLDMVQAVAYGTATPADAAKAGVAALSEILSRIKN